MDPASATATASPASTWRRSVRRRSLGGAGAQAAKEGIGRRAEELEEAVWRLRAEKDAAEDAAAALRAELDAERGAAETAASEAMLMIARLQREKAAAMMEARELRGLAEGRAGRDRDLQDRLAVVSALAASYAAILRAHGIDPDDDKDDENYDQEQEESAIERIEAGVEEDGENRGGDLVAKGAVVEEPSPPPPPAAKEYEYTIDVIRTAATKAAATAAGEERKRAVVDVAGGLGLYARVAALEADSAALRREVAALRAERAQVVLAREVARRLCWEAASARAVVATEERPRFSVLAICKLCSGCSPRSYGERHVQLLHLQPARRPARLRPSPSSASWCYSWRDPTVIIGFRAARWLQAERRPGWHAVSDHGAPRCDGCLWLRFFFFPRTCLSTYCIKMK